MSRPQLAITPEANPFSLNCLLKIRSNHENVLKHIKAIPQLVIELNEQQVGANLVSSIAFTHEFWIKTNQPIPEELEPFTPLGSGDITAPATSADVLIHCHSNRHDLHFFLLRKLMLEIGDDVEIVDETYGYRYLDSRDMTEFVDGTENPEGNDRYDVTIIPEGEFLWWQLCHGTTFYS